MYLIGNKVDRLYICLETGLLGHSDLKKMALSAGFLTWFRVLNPFHRHLFAPFINHYNKKYFSCFVFGKININNAKKAKNSCMSVDPWALTICMKIWWKFFVKWYGVFFTLKTGKGWSLTLVIQTKENSVRFGISGKKVIPRKVLPFFRNHFTGMNSPPWILSRITGLSKQMLSALYFPSGMEDRAIRLGKPV